MSYYTVFIPAAGSGKRMGAGKNKLFLEMAGIPVLIHTLRVFDADPACAGIVMAVKEEERPLIAAMAASFGISKEIRYVQGGAERQQSVAACIAAHSAGGIILVHDGARPFITRPVVRTLAETADVHGAAVAGVRAKDTMKFVTDGIISGTADRSFLWHIQTPQAFRYELLKEAALRAEADGFITTDESGLVSRTGHPVRIVESTYSNIKITTKEDLLFGEMLLRNGFQNGIT